MEAYSHRIAVLIPALNEEQSIGEVISGVRAHLPGAAVVVIDDASTDQTAEIAQSLGAVVLRLPIRLHGWGAMRTGFRYAVKKGFEIVLTIDADGQHLPETIGSLLEAVASGQADMAIGSCVERGSLGRRMAWRFFRRLTGLEVADLTSGFRAYHRKAAEIIMGAETALLDYQDIGVLLALKKAGMRIVEVPVPMCPRQNGISRVFASWGKVIRYLAVTMVVAVAKNGAHGCHAPCGSAIPRENP